MLYFCGSKMFVIVHVSSLVKLLSLLVKTNWLIFTSPLLGVQSIAMTVSVYLLAYLNKNSSGDEIANVNFYAVRPESYQIR